MDPKKIIKKYIDKPAWVTVLGVILLAAAAVLLFLGISAGNAADEAVIAQPYYPDECESGDFVYVDVIGISNWLYQYDDDTYYTILDAEGYMYTAQVSDSDYKKMQAQYDYWMDDNEDAVPPAPYRLEGMARNITSTIRSSLAESWDITTSEYDQYFGSTYLNANASPGSEAGSGYYLGAMLALIFGLCMVLICLPTNIATKKTLNRLEEQSLLERAAQQLEEGSYTTIGKDELRLSGDMLFAKGSGAAVPYSDILWIYRRTVRTNFVIENLYLQVNSKHYSFSVHLGNPKKGDPLLQQAAVTIAEKNPAVLIGYSKENQKAFTQLRKNQ